MLGQKNGKIEFLRFVFCMLVILFHCKNATGMTLPKPFSFFAEGKIGVEFFFLVSGYLLAANAKRNYAVKDVTKATERFMAKKLFSILPYHLIVYAICLALTLYARRNRGTNPFFTVIDTFPNLFFIQSSGIKRTALITPEWYVAAMLITMVLIYPLVLKHKERFTRLICPVIVILSVGYMIHTQSKLGGTGRWVFGNSMPKVYLRAFSEICGGVFCYEAAGFIKRLHLTKPTRVLLTLTEFVCAALPVAYSFSRLTTEYEAHAFYSLAIAVTLCFSGVTYFNKAFCNRFVYALGRLSLPLYYAQRIAFILVNSTAARHWDKEYQVLFCLAVTAAAALVIQPIAKMFSQKIKTAAKRQRSYARAANVSTI